MNLKFNYNKQFKVKYYITFIIFQIILISIKCEICSNCDYNPNNNECDDCNGCAENSCPDNCKPSIKYQKCINCTGINDKYYIKYNKDNSKYECSLEKGNAKKIIKNSNEYVDYCPSNTLELGDYCYFIIDDYTNIEILTEIPFKTLKCKNKYIKKTQDDGLIEYICTNDCKDNGYDFPYYNGETGECITECGEEKFQNVQDSPPIRCSSKCEEEEYIYINNDANNHRKFCLPNSDTVFYNNFTYEGEDGYKYIVNNCNDVGLIEIEGTKKCVYSCEYKNITVYTTEGKKCVDEIKNDTYYRYNNLFFISCNETQVLFNKTTYEYNSTDDYNICVEDCSLTDKPFLFENQCIQDCNETGFRYYYENTCLENCNSSINFTINTSIINNSNIDNLTIDSVIGYNDIKKNITHEFDFSTSYECLKECPIGTYIDEESKQCFLSNCLEFIDPNNKCVGTCTKEKGYILSENINIIIKEVQTTTTIQNSGTGSGRILEDDSQSGEIYSQIIKRFCLTSCPNSAPYHNNEDNICYITKCSERGKVSAFNNPYICYDKCEDIGGGYLHESNSICYNTSIICDKPYYYIDIENGFKKCATTDECKNRGYNYLRDKECVKSCDSSKYYSYRKDDENLGECLLDPNDCIKREFPYFNKTDKICQKECLLFKISDPESSLIKNNENETCFSECPNNYPYKDDTNRVCLKKCPSYFDGKKCVDKCPQFHFEDSYECVDNCTKDGKEYYQPENNTYNICYYTCPSDFPYLSQNGTDGKYYCIDKCPDEKPYFYEDKKICRQSCTLYQTIGNQTDNITICVDECPQNQKIYNQFCIEECPSEASFIQKETLSTGKIRETCTKACPIFISNSSKECLDECTIFESYEYVKYCYKECPNGTFAYDEGTKKKCSDTGCPKNTFKFYQLNKDNGVYECKKNCSSDKYYQENGGECYDHCPKEYNYIGGNNLCIKSCIDTFGKYYQLFENQSDYNIYKCVHLCDDGQLLDDETNFCIDGNKCPNGTYKSPYNICYSSCKSDQDNPFSTKNDANESVCAKKCHQDEPNYGSDYKCQFGCQDESEIIDYDGACVNTCNNSLYKYKDLEKKECVKECGTKYIYHELSQCTNECLPPHNHIEGNECKKECDYGHFKFKINDTTPIYECKEKCDDNQYYYESSKECLLQCKENHFIIQGENKCVPQCPPSHHIYYFNGNENSTYKGDSCVLKCPEDKPYEDENRKCESQCRINKYHNEGYFKCIYSCTKGLIEYNYECRNSCPEEKPYTYKKNCFKECPSDNKFYIPGEYECLKNCDETKYRIEENKCLESCNENPYYLKNNNTCVKSCPEGSRYIIENDIFGKIENYIPITCFSDCPTAYPYFTNKTMNETDPESITLHICKSDCDYKGENISENSIECLDFCHEFQYYDKTTKQCGSNCTNERPYYVEKNNTNITYYQCYKDCPNDFPFKNGSQCVQNCEYVNYDQKICVNNCDEGQKIFYDINTHISYCLNNCISLGLFEDGDKCVSVCNETRGLIGNMASKTCECNNLFYIDKDDKEKYCLEDSKCSGKHKYRKYGGKECLDDCKSKNGLISVNDDFCYLENKTCPDNTYNVSGQCKCSYKYYKENNQTICLKQNIECPSNYPLIDGKECVKNCSNIEYDGKCLTGSDFVEFTGGINGCSLIYYNYSEKKYICKTNQSECPENYYSYNSNNLTKCVKECSDSQYYIKNELNVKKECVSSCDNSYSYVKEIKNLTNSYECVCKNKWYKDDTNIKCALDDTKNCTVISEKPEITKYIKSTNECVAKCPDEYSYFFNNECFSSCEEAKNIYGYNVKNDTKADSKECICENLWLMNGNEKQCIEGDICNGEKYLLNNLTKECTNNCTKNLFNNKCYENCPSNTQNKENSNECECKYLWYEYEDKNNYTIKNCLSENEECPYEVFPYLNNTSKQCLKDVLSCQGKKIFNYTCYDECPQNTTVKKENEEECECNPNNLWYKYKSNDKIFFKCNVDKCPEGQNKIDHNTSECIFQCNDDQYYYEGKCYKECPMYTKKEDKISKICIDILTFDENKNLTDLQKIIKNDIKNIYEKASDGGLIYNKDNSTLQIYDIKNEKKDLIMRSNLTYIDFSNCIDKIYERQGIDRNIKLLVVKFDIGEKTDSKNINPVEFEIIREDNGESVPLDACGDNKIIISYPISHILNNFVESKNLRNLEEEQTNKNLNLKDKFLKGKELFLENEEIDAFNFENKLYTDMCYPCEINGKDLILEDRFNYLYPSSFSFCESNCKYDRTDYLLERVICNCSPKGDINFDRTFELQKNDVDFQKVKDNQKGSIMKCLGEISKISKNFGLYYGLIILLAEIGMGILTLLYSYKVLVMRIKKRYEIKDNISNNNYDTENIENSNLNEDNKYNSRKKTEEIIKTSERHLDNPPKKNSKKITINVVNNDKKDEKNKENKDKKDKKEKKDKKDKKAKKEEDPEVINIKKLKINKNKSESSFNEKEEKVSSNYNNNIYYEKCSEMTVKEMEDESIFDVIKMEKPLLTVDFDIALRKNKAEIIVIILTEILDKIYLFKAIWLLQKYELFSLYFTLYLLWHILVLSFLSLFYNNSTLQDIWLKNDYPDLNYYLSFGFVACIISFIFYKGLSFLINNEKQIKEKENNNMNEKFNKMMFWIKIKIIIFYAVVYVLSFIFFLYLIAFCGVYNATSLKLVESYGIALIEVAIIKVLYGGVLGILRIISLTFQIKILYTIVRFLDLYIS